MTNSPLFVNLNIYINIIKCNGARGTCHFFANKFSFWLTQIDEDRQFERPRQETLKGNLISRVSRCAVCVKVE